MRSSAHLSHRLRMKPLAAGLAVVLATGAFSLPTASLATGSSAKARSWHGMLAADPALKARVETQRQQQKTRRHQRLQALIAGSGSSSNATNATIAVSNCNDSGAGSLRDAIGAAATGDTIDLSSLTCSTITLTSGAIGVGQDDLTIQGPGAGALAVDGNASDVVFNFYGSGTLTIADTTLTNGYYYNAQGGAIWAYSGDVVLRNATISNISTYGFYSAAGGAAVVAYGGNITLQNATITGNSSTNYSYGYGFPVYGALSALGGTVTVTNSSISGNQAASDSVVLGAGVYSGGPLAINQSTIEQNSAASSYSAPTFGGGVYGYGGTTIADSTISGNAAVSDGGGVQSYGSLSVINSTVSGNQSDYYGAGIANLGPANISNSTVTANSNTYFAGAGLFSIYGTATLNSTIIHGNTSGSGAGDIDDAGTGSTLGGSNNLIGNSSLAVPGDTISSDPLLGPLQDNGGQTFTHALGSGSPAIDAGANPMSLANDQRGSGFAREAGGAADIGAFEVQATVAPPYVAVPSNATWAMGLLGTLLGWMSWLGLRRRRREESPGGLA